MNNGINQVVINQFDKIAELEDVWDHNQHYQKYLLRDVKHCNLAIDIGCGTGECTRAISKISKFVIGIDVSNKMVEKAKSINSELNIKYECIDFNEYFGKSIEKFDLIVSIAALHHMDEEQALLKMKRNLNSGGKIIILDLYKNETLIDYFLSFIAMILNPITMLIKRGRITITKEERESWKDHFQYDEYKTLKEIKRTATKVL